MLSLNLKSLIGHLNATCKTTLEGAAGLCLTRTQYNVEIEHWLAKLLEADDTDFAIILNHFDINLGRLTGDINRSLDRLRTGNSKSPALSPDVIDWVRSAWLLASLEYDVPQVRSAHLVMALVADDALFRIAKELSHEFTKISIENFQEQWENLLAQSSESASAPAAGIMHSAPAAAGGVAIAGGANNEALNQFTIDLTERARKGELDPVLGRDNEIRQIADILLRRRQNNPILTGEAGVGKTAVVEGFALRVVQGDVPPALKNIAVRILDLTLLQAGAGMKGEFENRLNSVIKAVKSSPQPIVLFIDEAHTMIGAGGAEGQGDAANLLKPALARGELRTIAATTWAEYKKYFEKDAALARRFQVVKVEEPDEDKAIEMMRGIAADLEKHHHVRILEEAIVASVKLSKRYIQGRQLPDKSVSLLDIACAKVGMGHTTDPAALEDLQRRIEQIQRLLETLKRETATGGNHQERIAQQEAELAATQKEHDTLKTRFDAEKGIVRKVRYLRYRLEQLHKGEDISAAVDARFADPAVVKEVPEYGKLKTAETFLSALKTEEDQLKTLQGEYPLLQVCVDAQAVASVVASWTGIPLGRMVSDEIRSVLDLEKKLAERVIGQDHALATIAENIHIARSGLGDPRKPIGVFMLAGTSGTGKTETALALADLLYGGEQNMTTINMSEFKEEHKVSMLLGSPPGYVGYGEGGVLTNAVRRRPYSVVLLDEMEKAHPGVQDIFYQVFDKGKIMDGEGREVDFKNTVIIMTTNAGTRSIMEAYSGDPEKMPNTAGELAERIRPELLKTFKPAFLGRINVIPYIPLDEEVIESIVRLQLAKVAKRIRENYNAAFVYGDDLVKAIAARCTEVETGARNVEHIITNTLLPDLANQFLSKMAAQESVKTVSITLGEQGEFVYTLA